MASYTKVFVQWEKRWWDDLAENPESAHKRNLFTVLLDEGDEQSKWRLVNDLLPLGKHPKSDDPQSRTLVFTSVGQESLRVQSLSESELKSELMAKLGRAFPQHSVPEPKAIYSPKWDHDPLFRGAFSVVEATDTVDADSDLRAPILQDGHGAIHFAGEAMHAFYKGYLSTAYLSGQEEA